MARGRLISRTLGSSRKFTALAREAGEFAQLLYPLLVANSDDHGRMAGDAFTVKFAVFPTSRRTEEEFEAALNAMHKVGLILLYQDRDKLALQITDFDCHQPGLHRRTDSEFAAPASKSGAAPPLSASERQIEDFLAGEIRAERLRFGAHRIVSVEQQVRRHQYYLDIVAKTDAGVTLVIEVKRQRVSTAALEQVRGYVGLIGGTVEAVVIGHGLAAGLDTAVSDVLIGTYDDSLCCIPVNVDACSRTFQHAPEIPSEEKRTEGKGREGKRTEVSSEPPFGDSEPSAGEAVAIFPVVGKGGPEWTLYEAQVASWQELYPTMDVLAEVRKALAWCAANPGRRKTAKGMPPFLVNWLNKATNGNRGAVGAGQRTYSDFEVRKFEDWRRAMGGCGHTPRCEDRATCIGSYIARLRGAA